MGPLNGLRVVEMAGIGPAPFCAMLLADMGAEVIRIDRTARGDLGLNLGSDPRFDVLRRGRKSIALDLKKPEAVAAAKKLIAEADVLVEGFRPGTMERLGLGPEECLSANPKLVYGRMTGFGQEGPEAARAGHDINYIALSGVLSTIGRKDGGPGTAAQSGRRLRRRRDVPSFRYRHRLVRMRPIRQRPGSGRRDGRRRGLLSTAIHGMKALGLWPGGARQQHPGFRRALVRHLCNRGRQIRGGRPVEQRFFQELLSRLQIDPATFPEQFDRARWPESGSDLRKFSKARRATSGAR